MEGNHREFTILELDIVSSYGFAGSHVQTPKGFCTAFKNKEGKYEDSAPGFSDFGGGSDNNETFLETAVRES
jgi:hypothetical protein